MEPFCFLFPVQRAAIEAFEPEFAPLERDPATDGSGSRPGAEARDEFHARMAARAAASRRRPLAEALLPRRRRQRRGAESTTTAPSCGCGRSTPAPPPGVPHRPGRRPAPNGPSRRRAACGGGVGPAPGARQARMAAGDPRAPARPGARAGGIERRAGLSREEFLERYYAANRPVILTGEMADWPALTRWTPDYLEGRRRRGRSSTRASGRQTARFEMDKDAHRRRGAVRRLHRPDHPARSGQRRLHHRLQFRAQRRGAVGAARRLRLLGQVPRPAGAQPRTA